MKITAEEIYKSIEAIRSKSPVVHNITNYVVMNSTANALLAIGAHWLVSVGVTAAAAVWAWLYFRGAAPAWLSRVLFVLVVIRFAIPVVTIGSDWVFQGFLATQYQQAQKSLDAISANASKPAIQAPAEAKDEGFWDKLRRLKDAAASLDVRGKLAELQSALDKATDHIVDLMVVFVMQTIVVPVVLLWALLKVAGGVLLSRGAAGVPRMPA